jgi:hypothetical protein
MTGDVLGREGPGLARWGEPARIFDAVSRARLADALDGSAARDEDAHTASSTNDLEPTQADVSPYRPLAHAKIGSRLRDRQRQ